MTKQIVIKDENNVKLGIVFPRRAKQLVNKQKARWLDEEHSEIVLIPTETEGIKMDTKIDDFANEMLGVSQDSDIHDIKKELAANLYEKYEDLIGKGMDKDEAIESVIRNASGIDKLIKGTKKGKSIIKDAYRDSASVILRSSPVEIIKKSKRRTRELHLAFSAVLWAGAAILYFGSSFLLGFTELTWRASELSWTWLIFVFAALIECNVEIFFCRKELAVLNENIDLRQINPARSKEADLDLIGYQKRLAGKIKLMSYAVLWIPLIIIYFVCGYAFGLWNIAWVVFVFGAFFELLLNFLRKLKRKED